MSTMGSPSRTTTTTTTTATATSAADDNTNTNPTSNVASNKKGRRRQRFSTATANIFKLGGSGAGGGERKRRQSQQKRNQQQQTVTEEEPQPQQQQQAEAATTASAAAPHSTLNNLNLKRRSVAIFGSSNSSSSAAFNKSSTGETSNSSSQEMMIRGFSASKSEGFVWDVDDQDDNDNDNDNNKSCSGGLTATTTIPSSLQPITSTSAHSRLITTPQHHHHPRDSDSSISIAALKRHQTSASQNSTHSHSSAGGAGRTGRTGRRSSSSAGASAGSGSGSGSGSSLGTVTLNFERIQTKFFFNNISKRDKSFADDVIEVNEEDATVETIKSPQEQIWNAFQKVADRCSLSQQQQQQQQQYDAQDENANISSNRTSTMSHLMTESILEEEDEDVTTNHDGSMSSIPFPSPPPKNSNNNNNNNDGGSSKKSLLNESDSSMSVPPPLELTSGTTTLHSSIPTATGDNDYHHQQQQQQYANYHNSSSTNNSRQRSSSTTNTRVETVLIHGPSGVGKSFLVQDFKRRIEQQQQQQQQQFKNHQYHHHQQQDRHNHSIIPPVCFIQSKHIQSSSATDMAGTPSSSRFLSGSINNSTKTNTTTSQSTAVDDHIMVGSRGSNSSSRMSTPQTPLFLILKDAMEQLLSYLLTNSSYDYNNNSNNNTTTTTTTIISDETMARLSRMLRLSLLGRAATSQEGAIQYLMDTIPDLKRIIHYNNKNNTPRQERNANGSDNDNTTGGGGGDDDDNDDAVAAPASSVAAMKQFGLIFIRILRVIGKVVDNIPIILLMDDLQWADSDSLDVFSTLIGEKEIQNLMLIGIFREHDDDDHHHNKDKCTLPKRSKYHPDDLDVESHDATAPTSANNSLSVYSIITRKNIVRHKQSHESHIPRPVLTRTASSLLRPLPNLFGSGNNGRFQTFTSPPVSNIARDEDDGALPAPTFLRKAVTLGSIGSSRTSGRLPSFEFSNGGLNQKPTFELPTSLTRATSDDVNTFHGGSSDHRDFSVIYRPSMPERRLSLIDDDDESEEDDVFPPLGPPIPPPISFTDSRVAAPPPPLPPPVSFANSRGIPPPPPIQSPSPLSSYGKSPSSFLANFRSNSKRDLSAVSDQNMIDEGYIVPPRLSKSTTMSGISLSHPHTRGGGGGGDRPPTRLSRGLADARSTRIFESVRSITSSRQGAEVSTGRIRSYFQRTVLDKIQKNRTTTTTKFPPVRRREGKRDGCIRKFRHCRHGSSSIG